MSPINLSCRQIRATDLPALIDLLHEGFPERSRSYWVEGPRRLAAYTPPPNCPRLGHVLEACVPPLACCLRSFRRARTAPAQRCAATSRAGRSHRSSAPMPRYWCCAHSGRRPRRLAQRFASRRNTADHHGARLHEVFAAACLWHCPCSGGPAPPSGSQPTQSGGARLVRCPNRTCGCARSRGLRLPRAVVRDRRCRPAIRIPAPRIKAGRIPCAQLIYCRSLEALDPARGCDQPASRAAWAAAVAGAVRAASARSAPSPFPEPVADVFLRRRHAAHRRSQLH
jgi:hypothetical protein